jgi:protease-4
MSTEIIPNVENKNQQEEKRDNNQEKPIKRRSSGCVIALVISIALLSAFFIIIGIIIVTATFLGGQSGSISEKIKTFSFANDGLVEKFVEGHSFSGNKIAMIEIKGVIMDGAGGGMWAAADSSLISKQLDRAANDPNVKAVILYLDTPGGEVTASDNIHERVLRVKAYGKPVVSYMNAMAASGGYYIAVASDHIIAHRLCITGSIGVIIQSYNYHNLFNKIGLYTETYKSGAMKDMLDGSKIRTEEEKILTQKIVDKIYSEFVDIVAAGRKNLSAEKIKTTEIGDGRIFLGEEAVKLGMIDSTGFFPDAVTMALSAAGIPEDNYKIVSYQKVFSFSEIFSQMQNSEGKISLDLTAPGSWATQLQPGKAYFLPPK